jgi:hypothetical protein
MKSGFSLCGSGRGLKADRHSRQEVLGGLIQEHEQVP